MKGSIITCSAAISTVAMLSSVSCSDTGAPQRPTTSTEARTIESAEESKKESSGSIGSAAGALSPAQSKVKAGEITGVDVGQVFAMMQADQILLIDCRPSIFYRMGHIDGSISLPLKRYDKVIASRKQDLDQAMAANKVIVLYCQNLKCPDAYAVARKLSPLGYPVSIYKGGWEEWKQSGL